MSSRTFRVRFTRGCLLCPKSFPNGARVKEHRQFGHVGSRNALIVKNIHVSLVWAISRRNVLCGKGPYLWSLKEALGSPALADAAVAVAVAADARRASFIALVS